MREPQELNAETFIIRPMSVKEFTELYQVSNVTFKKWLHPIQEKVGARNGWFYSIQQTKIIIEHLGFPQKLNSKMKKMKALEID